MFGKRKRLQAERDEFEERLRLVRQSAYELSAYAQMAKDENIGTLSAGLAHSYAMSIIMAADGVEVIEEP
jgi:hypothetical protein